MGKIKEFFGFIKTHPGKIAVVAVVSAVFLGGMIVGLYNKLRAKVPQLPAPR